jgi:hypothetical protein
MTIRLNGSTSGYTEIDAPAVAGSNTLVLPTGNGTADQALVTNGSGALSWADRGRMVLSTAQNSTSGTSIDFTGIPSWVKRVTVTGINVSTNGSSIVCLKLGTSSGIVTSGYVANYSNFNGLTIGASGANTGEFPLAANITAADTRQFTATLVAHGSNGWLFSGLAASTNVSGNTTIAAGAIFLTATLDRVRITTINGTDAFDFGSVNILYEG